MQNDYDSFNSFETFEPFAPPPRDLKQDRRQVAVVAFSISSIFASSASMEGTTPVASEILSLTPRHT